MASSCHEIPLHAGVEENAEWLEELLADLEPDLPHSDESVFSKELKELLKNEHRVSVAVCTVGKHLKRGRKEQEK